MLSVSAPGSGSASRIEADLVISNFGLMRLLDLRSDDATKITTGFAVSQEPNPDLGLHGARWLLASRNYPLAFRALRAGVREQLVRELGPDGFMMCTAELQQLALSKLSVLPGDP